MEVRLYGGAEEEDVSVSVMDRIISSQPSSTVFQMLLTTMNFSLVALRMLDSITQFLSTNAFDNIWIFDSSIVSVYESCILFLFHVNLFMYVLHI